MCVIASLATPASNPGPRARSDRHVPYISFHLEHSSLTAHHWAVEESKPVANVKSYPLDLSGFICLVASLGYLVLPSPCSLETGSQIQRIRLKHFLARIHQRSSILQTVLHQETRNTWLPNVSDARIAHWTRGLILPARKWLSGCYFGKLSSWL